METLAEADGLAAGQSVTSGPQEVMVTKVEETSVSVTLAAETEAATAAATTTVENCIIRL